MTSHCGWVNDRNSLMTLVKISFGGTRSRIIWHKTFPNISPVQGVVNLIRWNKMSMRSVDCNITSGSSWTMPFEFSVFFSWSLEPFLFSWIWEILIWKKIVPLPPEKYNFHTYWCTSMLWVASMPVLRMLHCLIWINAKKFARFCHGNRCHRRYKQPVVEDPAIKFRENSVGSTSRDRFFSIVC